MNLKILSWNSHAINDVTSYVAYVLPESKFDFTSQPVYQDRAEGFPALSGAVLPPHSFTFQVTINSDDFKTVDALREQLAGWFSILDFQTHALIAEDQDDVTAGVKRQYQLIGLPSRLAPATGAGDGQVTFLITLAVMEPVWQAVTASTDTWAITATGQSKTINVLGNTPSLPKFAITPTTARTGQFPYSRWVPVYNRVTVPLMNYSVDVTNGGLSTTTLVSNTAVSNQINIVGGINNSVTTIPIDTPVGGGLPAGGGVCYCGTEQILYTANTGTNLTGCTRGYGGTTAASHADNAVLTQSKMLADGSDIAVQVDGNLVNLWVDSPNTASTKVWIAQNWQVGQAGTLRTALPNNATAVTVQFTKNTINLNALKALKTARNSVFLIGNEAFTFSPGNVDLVAYQITSCSRAQKYTSAAAHAIAAAITWIEHDIWMLYGNSAGSPLTVDDTQKPLLNLNTSTNTSWVQTQFFDSISSRPAAWVGSVISSALKKSATFTGNQKALANPSSELGLDLINDVVANLWKSETAGLVWSFYHPCGITTVSMAGSKYLFTLTGTAWPAIAGLQKSSNGVIWITVWTEAIPAAANTWTAWTHNIASLGATFTNIRLALIGSIAAQPSNDAAIQGDTVTLALDSTKTPVVALNQENSICYLNTTITNAATGDYFTVSYPVALGHALTIDTAKKTVQYDDGSNAIAAIVLSTTRNNWLPLLPDANVLSITDTGIANISIVTTWNIRNL